MSQPPREATEALLNRLAAPDAAAADGQKFDGADLRWESVSPLAHSEPPPAWADLVKHRVSTSQASLASASMRSANLSGVCLERANFAGADLADAVLVGAVFGGADFTGALLEDADLRDAHLRFAKFGEAALEGADLRGADLWGAKCQFADLDRIDFRSAELEEADLRDTDARECDFREARLGQTDFRGADLRRTDFRGALLRNTKFDGADLRLANFAQADLSQCTLRHAWLADTRLERTRLYQRQIGGKIGEEIAGEFELAARGYLTLERNFVETGDPEGASWAYRKRRRMVKRQNRREAAEAFRKREFGAATRATFHYASDLLVEAVCDYGESVPRLLSTMLAVFFVFTVGYLIDGAVTRDVLDDNGVAIPGKRAACDSLADVAIYSLTAMVAPGNPPEELHPANSKVQLVTMVQSFWSIFLIGLLGFVAGNRIRR